MRLRRKRVDLSRLRLLHDADDVGRIGHVAIVQMERNTRLMRIVNEMVEAHGIEGRRAAPDSVDHVTLGKKKLGEVGAVLTRRAGDESHFARCLSHFVTLATHPLSWRIMSWRSYTK